MPLWTDLIDPVEATGIARDEQYLIEQQKGGTLARFLPNVLKEGSTVEFYPSDTGLVDAASYRAFGAPPEIGKGQGLTKKSISLPPISRNEPIDEATQMNLTQLSDGKIKKSIESAIRRNVQAISMRQELARGAVIDAGALVVDQANFWINDVFGRDGSLSVSAGAGNWWTDVTVSRLTQLGLWIDIYAGLNKDQTPGALVFGSRSLFTTFASGNEFKTIVGSSYRPPSLAELNQYAEVAGLPPMEVYARKASVDGVTTPILNPKKIYFLPEPTEPDNELGGVLGATYWGRTVSAQFPSWGIEPDEQPGIVCGIFRDDEVGSSIEVQGDSMGEPVATNPNASMAIQVVA